MDVSYAEPVRPTTNELVQQLANEIYDLEGMMDRSRSRRIWATMRVWGCLLIWYVFIAVLTLTLEDLTEGPVWALVGLSLVVALLLVVLDDGRRQALVAENELTYHRDRRLGLLAFYWPDRFMWCSGMPKSRKERFSPRLFYQLKDEAARGEEPTPWVPC